MQLSRDLARARSYPLLSTVSSDQAEFPEIFGDMHVSSNTRTHAPSSGNAGQEHMEEESQVFGMDDEELMERKEMTKSK